MVHGRFYLGRTELGVVCIERFYGVCEVVEVLGVILMRRRPVHVAWQGMQRE